MKSILLFVILGLAVAGRARAQDALFIAHPSLDISTLSGEEVKNILLGTKSKWDSGNIKLIVLTEGATHDRVIQTYAQRSSDQFDKYWKKQVFSGKGIAPSTAKSDAEVVDYVSKNPGAFGYISAGAPHAGVKEITVK